MFYEISTRELAKFIGNTSFDLVATKASSDVGKRINGIGSNSYACAVYGVDIRVKDIKVDTFLDPKGEMTCIIHVPPTKYTIITEELGKAYPNGEHLSFEGETNPKDIEFKFKDVDPRSMDDFNSTLATVVSAAKCYITEEIAAHRHHEVWKVCCANVHVEFNKIFHNER